MTKHNNPWSIFNSKMNRIAKNHNISYPAYDDVISYIGEKPEDSPYFTWIMCHTRDYSKDLEPSDFFWNRQLKTSTLNKAQNIYFSIPRQQIKKALQKLDENELKDVLSEYKVLKFKRPYSRSESYYRSFIGTILGSYTIRDLWKLHKPNHHNRTEYRYIVECNRCHRIITKRSARFLKKSGIFCLNCTHGLYRCHRNSALLDIKINHDTDVVLMSEYSRYSSQGMNIIIDTLLDSEYDKQDIVEVFGISYF